MRGTARFLPNNQFQAALSANAPTALNPFATIADIPAAQDLQSVLNTGSTATITTGSPIEIINQVSSPEQTRFYMDDLLTEWSATGLTGKMQFQIDGTSGMQILDNELSKGVVYAADYSSNFTARSLIDRGFADATYLSSVPNLQAVLTAGSTAFLTSASTDLLILDGVGFVASSQFTFSAIATGETNMVLGNTSDLGGSQTISFHTDGATAGTGYMRIGDGVNSKGLEYEGDYSANFTTNSLISKKYVDDLVAPLGNGIYGFSNNLTVAHTASLGAFGLTFNTSLAGKFNIRQANYAISGAVTQTRITNDKGDILNISNGNHVEWNNQNVGGVSQNIVYQNWIGHFNRYQFRSAIHAGSQPNNYNLMEVQLGASPPMSPVNIGINVTAPALSGVAVRQRMSRAGSSTVNQIHTGYELYDDVGTLNIGTQAGFSTYKTGFSANLNDIYTRSVAGALKNINRAFHANAQNGDYNYAFHAENGDIIVNSGRINVAMPFATPGASKINVTGDIEVYGSANGLILEAPDTTRYRVTVTNAGALTIAAV
jgi:hypothetical protein